MTKQIVMILGIGFLIFIFLIGTMFPPLWSLMSPRAPRPEIRYGEFAFRLEYEHHGEMIIIEDTVIVEHGGTSWDAGIGNHNVWNNRLASGNSEIIELYRSETEIIFIGILRELRGGYLLGTDSIREDSYIYLPTVVRVDLNAEGMSASQEREIIHFFSDNDQKPNLNLFTGNTGSIWQITEEYLFQNYGIQLISFEYDPPIVNSFR